MATPPRWARKIVAEVAPGTEIRWYWKGRYYSSGFYHSKSQHISVSAGESAPAGEVLMTLLHELAHRLVGANGNVWHGKEFWRVAWDLYRRYGLKDRDILKWEGYKGAKRYMPPAE